MPRKTAPKSGSGLKLRLRRTSANNTSKLTKSNASKKDKDAATSKPPGVPPIPQIFAGVAIESLRSKMGDRPVRSFRECGVTWWVPLVMSSAISRNFVLTIDLRSTVLDMGFAKGAPIGIGEIRHSLGIYFELDAQHCYVANIPTNPELDRIASHLTEARRQQARKSVGQRINDEIAFHMRNLKGKNGRKTGKVWKDDWNAVRSTLTLCVDQPSAMTPAQTLIRDAIFEWSGGKMELAYFGHQCPGIAENQSINTSHIGVVRHAGFVVDKPGTDEGKPIWLSRVLDYRDPDCCQMASKRIYESGQGLWKGILVTGDGNGLRRGSWSDWLKVPGG
ncbi:MAG: hypothetical protein Q9159_000099 [Coniocarpon cinnabarinum]